MTFQIPKDLKSLNSLVTNSVLPVELNDTDVDRMLTRILEMAVKRGRTASSKVNANDYQGYLDLLQNNPHLDGFDSDRGRDVLDGWVRSSILKEERASLRRDRVQMGYLRPLTVAAYRSGLPKTASRNRRADSLIYRSMERSLSNRGSQNTSAEIEALFAKTFGRGVDTGTSPWHDPRYDGHSELDIDTLLALRFLEGFQGSQNLSKDQEPLDPPVPLAVDGLGNDLTAFLRLFGPKLPVAEAYAHLGATISLRLFQLPLITARAVRALLTDEPQPVDNGSEMYCDFVRRRGSASDELSRQCVARDLETMRVFFGDRLLLRSLGDAVNLLPNRPDLNGSAAERLAILASLRDEPTMHMALSMQLQTIAQGIDDPEGRQFISDVRESGVSAAEQLRQVLVEGLRKRGIENQIKWFHSTGAITKSYGVLAGTLRSRSTWRYSLSDEALTTLLCMCFVDDRGDRTDGKLPIKTILSRLESRFGIIIDRPPTGMDSADARAGITENLTAFTRQLTLLGCFEGLSDDFTAQFVTRPREAVQ